MPFRRTMTVVTLVAFGLGVVGLASSASAAPRHHHRRDHHRRPHFDSHPGALAAGKSKTTSQNWSGYVVSGGAFKSISGSWSVPAVDCSSTPNGVAAMWVGLDGAGSNTVEQTGTFSACERGQASYAAWYEAFPAPSVIVANTVGPGDLMTATVTSAGPQTFQLVLTDNSRGWTSTNTVKVRGRGASAEVIAEAPSVQGQIVPLANFGAVAFSNVTVNGAPLAATRAVPVTMASISGVIKALPGAQSGGGFSVAWRHA